MFYNQKKINKMKYTYIYYVLRFYIILKANKDNI